MTPGLGAALGLADMCGFAAQRLRDKDSHFVLLHRATGRMWSVPDTDRGLRHLLGILERVRTHG